jgi:hypothetical protein
MSWQYTYIYKHKQGGPQTNERRLSSGVYNSQQLFIEIVRANLGCVIEQSKRTFNIIKIYFFTFNIIKIYFLKKSICLIKKIKNTFLIYKNLKIKLLLKVCGLLDLFFIFNYYMNL